MGAGTAAAPLHDLAFRGLTFSHATWLAPNARTGFPQIIGSWFSAGGKGSNRMPGQVTFRAAERISIEGNHFTHLGGLALVLSRVGSNNTVRDNVVDDVSGGGVEVRGRGGGNRVEDNWVHHIGIDYRSSVGISLEGSPGATVAHNQVNHVPYTGIWGESPGGTGIYPDVGADWVTLERNVLYGSDDAVAGVQPRRISDRGQLLGRSQAALVAEGHTHRRNDARRQHAAAARQSGSGLPRRRHLRRHSGHSREAWSERSGCRVCQQARPLTSSRTPALC